jgi:hypothetical protein
MTRRSKSAPFKLKYTDGRKASPSAFFQMANPNQPTPPNPAVDQAINRKMEEQIDKKVNNAMSQPGDSPLEGKIGDFLGKIGSKVKDFAQSEKGKKLIKTVKKVGEGIGVVASSGLDAVYGTGKIAPSDSLFSKDETKDEKKDDDPEENIKKLKEEG